MRWNHKTIVIDPIAIAPSVRSGEVFRATKNGLERIQSLKLRRGGKFNRTDELPYNRIASLSYEERVIPQGSKLLGTLGIFLIMLGLGVPALSSLNSNGLVSVLGGRITGLTSSFALPDIAGVTLGVALLASKFPRRTREGWWQVKGQDMTMEDQRGWQVAAGVRGTEELVRAIREGISNSSRLQPSKSG